MSITKVAILGVCICLLATMFCGCSKRKDETKTDNAVKIEDTKKAEQKELKTQTNELTEKVESDNIKSANSEYENQKVNEKPDGLLGYDIAVRKAGESKLAYIEITKNDLQKASEEEFRKFAEENIKGKPYNWFTIFFEDGTGVQFSGCNYTTAMYGVVDTDGCIDEPIGYIWMKEGKYIYEE